MITIIDYGLGNVLAFQNVYKRLNVEVAIARDAAAVDRASRLILPGVGAFDHAMQSLDRSGMRPALDRAVVTRGVPVLGVCVGMQMLARSSEEGSLPGLGWVDGVVSRFGSADTTAGPTHVPHMGWNDVTPAAPGGLFAGLEDGARFYFLHSYYFRCERHEDDLATTTYGFPFSSAVRAGHVYGVQFHPEKSHHFGTQLLRNFAEAV